MGERHQIFAIARTRRSQTGWACVVALHNQRLRGWRTVSSAQHVLNAIKKHASTIQTELRLLDDPQYEPTYVPGSSDSWRGYITATPFLALLMQQTGAWGCSMMACGVLPGDWANDYGITICDVSDPIHPRYAFSSLDGIGPQETVIPKRVPLSGSRWIRAYYPQGDEGNEQITVKFTHALEDMDTIPADILKKTWPKDGFTAEDDSESQDKEHGAEGDVTGDATKADGASLNLTSFQVTLNAALQSKSAEDMKTVLATPFDADIVHEVYTALRSLNVVDEFAAPMLVKALQSNVTRPAAELDLSGFQLTPDAVVEVVSAFPDIASLNLSGNRLVTDVAISDILTKHSKTLRSLTLLGTTTLEKDEKFIRLAIEGEDPNQPLSMAWLTKSVMMGQPDGRMTKLAGSGAFDGLANVIFSPWLRVALQNGSDPRLFYTLDPPEAASRGIPEALSLRLFSDAPDWDPNAHWNRRTLEPYR